MTTPESKFKEMCKANECIHDAASDLYVALKGMLNEPSLNLQADDGTELAPWLANAYAAIRKAEGR